MSKRYDSTTKYLIENYPSDWLELAGLEARGPIELIDSNLSTVTAEADKVIRVDEPAPWLVHIELQANRDLRIGCRLFRYNALLDDRHGLPTRSVVILLRPEADGPEVTGEYRRSLPQGSEYLVFRYEAIRIWEQPVELILNGGLGILPLAPVADLASMPIEEVVRVMTQRIDQEPLPLSRLLWTSTSILMGLRLPFEQVEHLLRGTRQMKESSVYQAILAEGRAEGEARGQIRQARETLLLFAKRRFGSISSADRNVIDAMTDVDRLRDWTGLVFEASTWAEFWALANRDPAK